MVSMLEFDSEQSLSCSDGHEPRWAVCVCVIQRDLVALVLLLAGGRLAMVEAGGGRRGKFNIVSSKWGDGWRGGDWLCEFYTNRNGQYAFWTKCTYTRLSGDLPDCFEWVAPRTLRSLSSSGWSFLSFRDTQSADEHLIYNFIKEQASYKCKKCDRQGSAYSLRTWWWRLNRVFLAYCGCNSSLLLYFLLLTVCYLWSYCCQTSTLPGQVHAIRILLGLIWILIPLNMSDTGSRWVTVLKRGDDNTLAECVRDCVCSKRADYGRDIIKETGHSKRELLRFLLCFLSPSKYIFQRLRPALLISYREYTSICLLFFLSVKHNFSCTVSRPYCEKKIRTLGGVKWSMTEFIFSCRVPW